MHRVSATGIAVALLVAGGCVSARARQPGDEDIVNTLAKLGFEGRSYTHDLGQAASVHVHRVVPVDGDFLIEDIHGHLTYVDGATLDVRWEFYGLPGAFEERPDTTPSAVIGFTHGRLYVVDRSNGTMAMDPQLVDVIPSAAPVATDSTVYVPTFPTPSGNKTVYAVSLGSGFVGWGWRGQSDVIADMAKGGPMAGDTVYFASANGGIYAYPASLAAAAAPEPAWANHAQSRVELPLVVEGEDLGVVTTDGRMIVLNRVTGHVRWEAFVKSPGDRPGSAAQFSSGMAFYVCGGELRAYDRASGTEMWTFPGATRYIAERDGRVLLGGKDGMLFAVERDTGKMISHARLANVNLPVRVAADGTLFAITNHGVLVAIEHGW